MTDLASADFGIRQLMARFADAVWRQDADDFAACFAEDGQWKIAGMDMSGREAIREGCNKLLPRCEWIHLLVGQPQIQADGDEVTGRLSMTELAKMPDGSGWMTIGFYHDRYVNAGGQWLFKKRHWSMKYRGPFALDGIFAGTPDYGSFPGAPAADEETFVKKA